MQEFNNYRTVKAEFFRFMKVPSDTGVSSSEISRAFKDWQEAETYILEVIGGDLEDYHIFPTNKLGASLE
jgi:hypothetical protein